MVRLLLMALTIFVAELGDKTQVATLLFAADRQNSPWAVFIASASALVMGAAISVALGTFGRNWLQMVPLRLIAGIAFIAIGLWSLAEHFRGA
ncbi:MAG: TMEM165/GDT1 family protein [Alphaproteobacteria bacterium]|nr:TMEM165/GDT1 family protein [Alphaproteobacteria bacterium]